MNKHLAFWIGFFSAVLLSVRIVMGIWGATQDFARDLAVFLFGVIVKLLIGLVVMLFFRDYVLRKTLGAGEASIQDITDTIVSGVASSIEGDVSQAKSDFQKLGRIGAGWYAWTNFYRYDVSLFDGALGGFDCERCNLATFHSLVSASETETADHYGGVYIPNSIDITASESGPQLRIMDSSLEEIPDGWVDLKDTQSVFDDDINLLETNGSDLSVKNRDIRAIGTRPIFVHPKTAVKHSLVKWHDYETYGCFAPTTKQGRAFCPETT